MRLLVLPLGSGRIGCPKKHSVQKTEERTEQEQLDDLLHRVVLLDQLVVDPPADLSGFLRRL